MKHNTQILAPKYRTQNGKPPVSRLKRKPCCFSYFTSTSNGNYFRSFPLSLPYFRNYTGYRCRRAYISRFQPLNASPLIISDPTRGFCQSCSRVRCQKLRTNAHFRRRRHIYGMSCLYNYAIYNLWKHLRTQSRHCFQDNFMRSEFKFALYHYVLLIIVMSYYGGTPLLRRPRHNEKHLKARQNYSKICGNELRYDSQCNAKCTALSRILCPVAGITQ